MQGGAGEGRQKIGRRRFLAVTGAVGLTAGGGWALHALMDRAAVRPRQTAGVPGRQRPAPALRAPETPFPPAPASPRASALAPAASGGTQTAAPLPHFSDVSQETAADVLRFLAGRDPRYPGAGIDSLMDFSAADILESMDTDVLDGVANRFGPSALQTLYQLIAIQMLDSLLDLYGDAPLLLALDAGHGGKSGVYYDPGSNGTEAVHTRGVVAAVEQQLQQWRYGNVVLRQIFNDALGDDFGLPPPYDHKDMAQVAIRNARAAMLAREAAAWNQSHPHAVVSVQALSIHFNSGSHGILALHQGEDVSPDYRDRSLAYARSFVENARPALNASGFLPYPLTLVFGTGLSNDQMLYQPPEGTGVDPYTSLDWSRLPDRYGLLQASLKERDYVLGALRYHGLV